VREANRAWLQCLIKFKVERGGYHWMNCRRPGTKIMMNWESLSRPFPREMIPNEGVGLAREDSSSFPHRIHPLALIAHEELKKKARRISGLPALVYKTTRSRRLRRQEAILHRQAL